MDEILIASSVIRSKTAFSSKPSGNPSNNPPTRPDYWANRRSPSSSCDASSRNSGQSGPCQEYSMSRIIPLFSSSRYRTLKTAPIARSNRSTISPISSPVATNGGISTTVS